MTVSSTASSNDYVGDGTVSVYPYTYRIFTDTDLVVTRSNPTTGVETTLQLGVDYSVSGVGSPSGGNVFLTSNLPPSWRLNIRRVLPLVQELDVRNQGTFLPENHERAFDKLVMIDQQQQIDIARSLRLGETAVGVKTKLPAPVALRVLRWNAAADAIENADPGSVSLAIPGDGTVTNPKLAAAPAGTVKANLTGDVATIDPDGYMQITDRSKDVMTLKDGDVLCAATLAVSEEDEERTLNEAPTEVSRENGYIEPDADSDAPDNVLPFDQEDEDAES